MKAILKDQKIIKKEMKKTISVFQGENEFFEIRVLNTNEGVYSGQFSPDKEGIKYLFEEIKEYDLWDKPIYMTINEIGKQSLDNDNFNYLTPHAPKTTKDKDITNYRMIHIDADPVRPANIQATEEERGKAKEKLDEVVKWFKKEGFSEPIISFSGNGYNADFKVDYKNTKENVELTKKVLRIADKKYSDEYVKIDTTTYSPGQITKCHGCISAKGDDTEERPYRCSRMVSVPDTVEITDISIIETLVNKYSHILKGTVSKSAKTAKNAASKTSNKTEGEQDSSEESKPKVVKMQNIGAQLKEKGVEYKLKKDDDYTMWIFKDCPFNDHDNEYCSFIQKFKIDGNVFFKCHHDHCSDKNIFDLCDLLDLNYIPRFDNKTTSGLIINQITNDYQLIKDNLGNTYLINSLNKNVAIPLYSKSFDSIVYNTSHRIGLTISESNLRTIKNNLSEIITNNGVLRCTGERIAFMKKDQAIYYAISQQTVIKISATSVSKKSESKVSFIYNENFKKQVMPDFSSKATDLPMLIDEVFNIDDSNRYRFLAQLVCLFIPFIDIPIMIFNGKQGSGKSTAAKMIKSLVDPSTTNLIAFPNDDESMALIMERFYLTVFDNVDNINRKMADTLCLNCTGAFAVRRERFKDKNVVMTNLKGRTILTGIKDMVHYADLNERCNIIWLNPIEDRKTNSEIKNKFNDLKPKILGAIFNCVKLTLRNVNDMPKPDNLPRLAEFALYGRAAVKAMGLNEDEFLDSYNNYINDSVTECDENFKFFSLIQKFLINNNGQWSGTSALLRESLLSLCKQEDIKDITIANPSTLGKDIEKYKKELSTKGIEVNKVKGTQRIINLKLNQDKLDDFPDSPDSSDTVKEPMFKRSKHRVIKPNTSSNKLKTILSDDDEKD